MKDIKLMKWDNCYTFVLKMKGIFSDYISTDSCEFVDSHTLMDIPLTELQEGDILVWILNTDSIHSSARILYNGIPLHGKVTYHRYHFGIYLNGLVYDLSYDNDVNHLRVRKPCMLRPIMSENQIKVIRI